MPQQPGSLDVARGVLQAIFAVFLGLLITVVVGVGVNTFHPSPDDAHHKQVEELYEQRSDLDVGTPTPSEQAEIDRIDKQIEQIQAQQQEEGDDWAQSTSIILIVIATALMAISLIMGQSLALLSNGVLLGGLFTMLYGVGWGVASGDSLTRFLVLVVALVISLALGYLKFGRLRHPAPTLTEATAGAPSPAQVPASAGRPANVSAPGSGSGAAPADILARLDRLEARLDAAARGLQGRGHDD